MGNILGGKKSAKIMKIDGETYKLKTPVRAGEVVKNHPGLVVLDSQAVKQHGVRAKPLEVYQNLEPGRLYFLVELPKAPPKEKVPRRVRSSINMSAKDRLESLKLARRSVSDLSVIRPSNEYRQGIESSPMRVRMRLPKAEVERVMRESKDEAEAAEKIMELCKANADANAAHTAGGGVAGRGRVGMREHKRVSFRPTNEGENHS